MKISSLYKSISAMHYSGKCEFLWIIFAYKYTGVSFFLQFRWIFAQYSRKNLGICMILVYCKLHARWAVRFYQFFVAKTQLKFGEIKAGLFWGKTHTFVAEVNYLIFFPLNVANFWSENDSSGSRSNAITILSWLKFKICRDFQLNRCDISPACSTLPETGTNRLKEFKKKMQQPYYFFGVFSFHQTPLFLHWKK